MNKQEYEILRDAAAEQFVSENLAKENATNSEEKAWAIILEKTIRVSFIHGADFAYDLLQKRVNELEAKLAIARTALEDMTWSVDRRTAGIAKGTLAQIEGKAE